MFSLKFKLDDTINLSHGLPLSITPNQFIKIDFSIFHLFFISIFSLFMLVFPGSWLILIMPLTILSLLLGAGPFFIQPFLTNTPIVIATLRFLSEIKLMNLFTILYTATFYTQAKTYYNIRNICYGLTILYMLVTRYYFYHKVVLSEDFSFLGLGLIYLLLFFSFLGSYLRVLINISQIVCIVARTYTPELLNPILHAEPPELPPSKSIFSFSWHTHTHNHIPQQPKSINWTRLGFFVACGGLFIAGVTYYHTAQQTVEAQKQTAEAQKQTAEMKRKNDLEEVSLGLSTKEEYKKIYPKD